MRTEEQIRKAQEQNEKETAAAQILFEKLDMRHEKLMTESMNLPIHCVPNMRQELNEKHRRISNEMSKFSELKRELFKIAFPTELFPLFGWKLNF